MPADNGPEHLTTSPADSASADDQPSMRTRILDAATVVLANRNFDAESIRQITQEVGITTPELFRYFDGRDKLYAAVIDRESARLLEMVRAIVREPRPLADVLAKLAAALFEYVEDFTSGFRVILKAERAGLRRKRMVNEVADAIRYPLSTAGFIEPLDSVYAHLISDILVRAAAGWVVGQVRNRAKLVDYLTGFILNGVSLNGTVDLVVYTSANDGREIRDAMLDLLETAGWAAVRREPARRGSWFQRIWLRGRENGAVDKLNDVAAKLERSLTLKHIGAPRSENDEREAAAIERLAKATENVEEVAIKTSSILFVKHQGQLVVRVLTEAEIAVIDKHPELMRQPAELLASLNEPQLNRSDAS